MSREIKQLVITTEDFVVNEDGVGELSGYANVKNYIDAYGDKCIDGCYKGIDKLIKAGWLCTSHEWSNMPIGTITEAYEDAKGLFFKATFHSDEDSQKVRTIAKERMERGKQLAFSIGYFPTKYSFANENGQDIRILEEIEVFEVSVVTLPANDKSLAVSAKSEPGSQLVDELTKTLELASDCISRCEWINSNRKNGLSQERKTQLSELVEKLELINQDAKALLVEDVIEEVTEEVIFEDITNLNDMFAEIGY